MKRVIMLVLWLSAMVGHASTHAATIDLRSEQWGQGENFRLDGDWEVYRGVLLKPQEISITDVEPDVYPVPGYWGRRAKVDNPPPDLGTMTYRMQVLVPQNISSFYLYLPDMPSAYVLWANGEALASNGKIGYSESKEEPGFLPKVVEIENTEGAIELVIQLSNYHYREGGIWFSLRLTDESGRFDIDEKPVILAVFFAAILIVFALINLVMFAFRSQELAALHFGFLCLVVGIRRLLIDERVVYYFDWASWETLQRIEHFCFYLALPLFVGFFCSLYRRHVPKWTTRVCWMLTVPFFIVAIWFPTRIYVEFNIAFQMLIQICVVFVMILFARILYKGGQNTRTFGLSLLVMALCVTHDILKANGVFTTPNIAHFGALAFVVSQSIFLQRRYLKSLSMVEVMSKQLATRNQELEELDEFKDEFLATTSHELRTPLQGISGLAKALKEGADSGLKPDQKQKIELIANTSERLSVLVNDILDFSSIKHGTLTLHTGHVDMNEMADLVLRTMRPTLGNKAVQLTASIDGDCQYINADAFRLQQVLFNLIGNAVKYTSQGEIRLMCFRHEDECRIEVLDTGVGIPKEKQASLFKPFEQAHIDGHFTASGTGLGLSISQKLVELHGGVLSVTSKLGHGTRVTMNFPSSIIIEANGTNEGRSEDKFELTLDLEETNEAEQQEFSDSVQAKIFIVDDEQINLELLQTLLSGQNYQIEAFKDGIELLRRLSHTTPDLILLDYMMPGMTGVEVCQAIRKRFDAYELPVMMLTARHQVSDIVHALSVGANDYLTKPYHDKELLARVHSQLSVRRNWIANKENQKLRDEIERRNALEEQLADMNSQLLQAMDFSHDMIMLLSAEWVVQYANRRAIEVLSEDQKSLVGKTLANVLSSESFTAMNQSLATMEGDIALFDITECGKTWRVHVKPSNSDHLVATLFLAEQTSIDSEDGTLEPKQAMNALAGLTSELMANRKVIEELELALANVASSSNEDSLVEDKIGTELNNEPLVSEKNAQDRKNKENIADLLRLCLTTWEQYSGKGKVELAEMSRCWRVYVDGTTVKTRTFDKYLNASSVPDRPRWRAVVRTAHFVIAHCPLELADENRMLESIRAVEDVFA